MNNIGIIAEYNPFHEGHLYQLNVAREKYNADNIIVIMSGDFTQRGAPALFDKYERAETALRCGADMVVMMPLIFSVSSAEYFAKAGVKALIETGCCNALLFGSENDDIEAFKEVSEVISKEPKSYKETLKESLKQGMSFPLAREKAIRSVLSDKEFFLSSPNNILGLEYVKALSGFKSDITPIAIKRVGAGYHDASIVRGNETGHFVSSSAIRRVVEGEEKEIAIRKINNSIEDSYVKKRIEDPVLNERFLQRDDASLLLNDALIKNDDFSDFLDCTKDLSNRINKEKNKLLSFSNLNDALKTKELTYSRISRVLTHIMLNIFEDDIKDNDDDLFCPYLRVLGVSKRGESLLSEVKKRAKVPVLVNLKEDEKKLFNRALNIYKKDIYGAEIYRAMLSKKTNEAYKNDYQRKFLKIQEEV